MMAVNWVSAAAWMADFGAATVCYLASPHQRLLPRPLSRRLALPLATLLFALAAGLFVTAQSVATAIYCLVVVLMTTWCLGPLAICLLRRRA